MNKDIESVLVNETELDAIITRLAGEIDRDYSSPDKRLVLVSILKGSVMFTGALMAKIKTNAEIEFMKVSSYGSATKSNGYISVLLDLKRPDLSELDLLIVEDIIDSGRTLNLLTSLLRDRGAKSVRTVTMLDKPSRREVPFTPDYIGAEIPDKFVVGFGLDYDEKYRNLPYVGVLRPEVYSRINTPVNAINEREPDKK